MCGIAGIISTHVAHPTKLRADLQQMTDAIAHRGPDGEGFWINNAGQVGLGHRRLKIIDLSDSAAQPMHYNIPGSVDGAGTEIQRYTITYNGEIYNYPELRTELLARNYRFKTQSDTEVILAAYDCWKADCLLHFDGMFAFAIWDEQEQQLFCARDRFGEKPFYFYADDTRLLFASEMKALWAAGVAKKTRDTQLLNYLTIGLVQNAANPAETFFENIYSLQPGHHLTVKLPGLTMQLARYWDLDKETIDTAISEAEAIEKFSSLLRQSVSRRLRSDVKVGTSLSGGLDSSAIVASISQIIHHTSQIASFSAVFPGFEKDESRYIREVTQAFSVDNFQTTPTAEQLLADLDQLIYHQEEPFQSLSIYAQYKVYALAKQHGVTVILDGQGADESLAGYHKYYHWYWQELLVNSHLSMVKKEIDAARKLGVKDDWNWKNKLAAIMPGRAALALEQKAIGLQKKHPFISPDFLSAGLDQDAIKKPVVRKLNDILYHDTCQLGLQELLRYADRNSMAHGREVRLPFLNHELVQFIFSLPSHFKIKDGFTKWILRKAMDKTLPKSIVWRTDKIGYEPPQQEWMVHKGMHEKIMDSRKKLVEHRILKPSVMEQPIMAKAAHEAGNDDFRWLCAAQLV
ncbi:MAG: asparagine synthase (glutamine-hydrolyzing) [Bacteroidota bacterium]